MRARCCCTFGRIWFVLNISAYPTGCIDPGSYDGNPMRVRKTWRCDFDHEDLPSMLVFVTVYQSKHAYPISVWFVGDKNMLQSILALSNNGLSMDVLALGVALKVTNHSRVLAHTRDGPSSSGNGDCLVLTWALNDFVSFWSEGIVERKMNGGGIFIKHIF
jgi:hypothetical protein